MTKRVFLHPLGVSYPTLNFHESCLDDLHDTVQKRGFTLIFVVWPFDWLCSGIIFKSSFHVYSFFYFFFELQPDVDCEKVGHSN